MLCGTLTPLVPSLAAPWHTQGHRAMVMERTTAAARQRAGWPTQPRLCEQQQLPAAWRSEPGSLKAALQVKDLQITLIQHPVHGLVFCFSGCHQLILGTLWSLAAGAASRALTAGSSIPSWRDAAFSVQAWRSWHRHVRAEALGGGED